MTFTYDTESTLVLAAALVNTQPAVARSGKEELDSVAALESILDESGFSGRRDRNGAELDEVRVIRRQLQRFWETARDGAVPMINGILLESRALPQLVRHDQWDWHIHAIDYDGPLATRIRLEFAMAMVDVIRADEYERLRVCAADDCEAVLVDLSRNRSKRYCDTGNCGNRMNVIAYRGRRRAGVS